MIRELLYYGHPCLRKRCATVREIDETIRQIAQDLIDTVFEKNGAGLAAPQIGYSIRMFVSRYENGADSQGAPILCLPKIYINPILSNPSKEIKTLEEGCLSIPGLYELVTRPWKIDIEAIDLEGNPFSEQVTGWRARNVMHENDHLNGTLFIDRLEPKRRKKIDSFLRALKEKGQYSKRQKATH